MKVVRTALSRRAWDAALGPAAMQHCWTYGATAERFGARVLRVEITCDESRGFAQMLCRGLGPIQIGYMPLGVHWRGPPTDLALPRLRELLAQRGPAALVTPMTSQIERLPLRISGPREMSVLRMEGAPDGLRAAMHGKWRNRLSYSERAKLRVSEVRGLPGWLVATERRQQRARGYGNLPLRWIQAWDHLAPGTMMTLSVEGCDGPLAGMCFLSHGSAATYLLGWTGEEGRRVCAHNLLLWQAALRLKERGAMRLDLGQVDQITNPGLARFKRGVGAVATPVPPVRLLPPALAWKSRRRRILPFL